MKKCQYGKERTRMRKKYKIVFIISIILLILLIFRPYYSVNSLTKKYASEFSELYRDNGFYEDIEYFKVLKYRNEQVDIKCLSNEKLKNTLDNLNDDYAVVLYVEENHSSSSLYIFYDEDGQWKLLDWYLVWSNSGTADGFMWPYYP